MNEPSVVVLSLSFLRLPIILPSSLSRNNMSCRRTRLYLRFRWLIVLTIDLTSMTLFITSELLTFLSSWYFFYSTPHL